MAKVLYPGSFDPIHNGHIEIIETAARLFDEVVVAAMRNLQKGEPAFTLEEREAMINESLADLDNVSVLGFSGLVVDVAKDHDIDFIVKGLRASSDFEVELQMAQTNFAVAGVHTVFLPPASSHSFIASRFIRDMAQFGRDVSSMVPPPVSKRLQERYGR